MKISILPRTRNGWFSVCLLIGFFVLAVAGSYISSSQNNTIEYPNPINSPLLGTIIYMAFFTLFCAAVLGLIAILKEKERSIIVYLLVPAGMLVSLFALMLLIGGLVESIFSK